jgi:hypothetical protein
VYARDGRNAAEVKLVDAEWTSRNWSSVPDLQAGMALSATEGSNPSPSAEPAPEPVADRSRPPPCQRCRQHGVAGRNRLARLDDLLELAPAPDVLRVHDSARVLASAAKGSSGHPAPQTSLVAVARPPAPARLGKHRCQAVAALLQRHGARASGGRQCALLPTRPHGRAISSNPASVGSSFRGGKAGPRNGRS